jgi:hypothetical protein
MIKQVRFVLLAAALSVSAVSTRAQAQEEHKPGGLNDASKTHNALTDAGNNTKAELKRTTGIKGSQSHEPGGLNKVARDISKTSKKAGSDAKAEKNRAKSNAHGALTEAGKSAKDTTLKGKP